MACRPIDCVDGIALEGLETLLRRLIVVEVDGDGAPVLDDNGQPIISLRVNVVTCDE